MRKLLAVPFMALGLLVSPTFTGTSVMGENSSVRAEDFGVGVRVYDRDRDDRRWFHRRFYRDYDRDDVVIQRRYHRDYDAD